MKGNVIHIDSEQIKLINLIDDWIRDEMKSPTGNTKTQIPTELISTREFLTEILQKGWYREGSGEQQLLTYLRTEWIRNGGKWKAS